MLSVIEPDGAENFSIGQIIQVRVVSISDKKRRLDIKFIYSEKATQFCEIFTLLLTGTT